MQNERDYFKERRHEFEGKYGKRKEIKWKGKRELIVVEGTFELFRFQLKQDIEFTFVFFFVTVEK